MMVYASIFTSYLSHMSINIINEVYSCAAKLFIPQTMTFRTNSPILTLTLEASSATNGRVGLMCPVSGKLMITTCGTPMNTQKYPESCDVKQMKTYEILEQSPFSLMVVAILSP